MSTSSFNAYLTFKLDREIFAIPVEQVIEIIEVSQITKIPQTSDFVLGITNLRGNVLPVIDTRVKFGMEQVPQTIDSCIIVIAVHNQNEESHLGILVDSVMEVSEFEAKHIKAKPTIGRKFNNEYITGIVQSEEQFVLLLNVNKVFDNEEIIQMNELSDNEGEVNELTEELIEK
ncbi:chemotaxis protein CheW [bacterium]|nr:MAG: chemotaxis protein CheW [bacterium]